MRLPEQIDAKLLDIYLAQFSLTKRQEGTANINHPLYIYEHNILKREVHHYSIIISELIVLRIKVLE